jgi:alkaline phosphatase
LTRVRSLFCLIFIAFVFTNAQQNNKPQNIILLIGDGMGTNYVSASVLSMNNDPFRKFPVVGLSVTCDADRLVTESAAAATAIATGYRTNKGHLSVDPKTKKPMTTLFEVAEKIGKSTGVVVTSTVTHATPGAFLSHIADRSKENEIALQYSQTDVDVVIGGGLKFFGKRNDKINLVDTLKNHGYKFFSDLKDLSSYKSGNKFYALLSDEGLPHANQRNYSLSDLTRIALENLKKNKKGFVLMVEGSQIDWAGHDNNQDYLLSEQKDFNGAINTALEFAEKDGNTLVIVTADHETGGMAIVGGNRDGSDLKLKFSTGDHTAAMVGVFAKGPGQELFNGVYDNYMIGRKLIKLVDPTQTF